MYATRKRKMKTERNTQANNKQIKKRKNIPVYEREDIQMTDTWTRYLHFLHTVNFLRGEFIYTEDR
jgi:hypothetical protein